MSELYQNLDTNICKKCCHTCHCSNGESCCGEKCECKDCDCKKEEKEVDFNPDFSLTVH